MCITRTFHPVGHGAFSSERFELDSSTTLNVVYDCGAMGQNYKHAIDKAFSKKEVIDLLIISHFHKDHISGIPHLNQRCHIKRVLIPYMNNAMKVMFVAAIQRTTSLVKNIKEDLYKLILEPEKFFKETTIISVTEETSNNNDDNPPVNLSDLPKRINSGTKISISNTTKNRLPSWVLVPHNYYFPVLRDIIKNGFDTHTPKIDIENISITEIANSISARGGSAFSHIYRDAIKGKGMDLNDTSLMVYSGPDNTVSHHPFCGCLFLGDIGLEKLIICNDVISKYSPYLGNTGTIQIPHHGSKTAYHDNFWDYIHSNRRGFPTLGIVCHKLGGAKHPNGTVIGKISSRNVYIRSVTEDPTSIYMQP